MEIPTTFGYFLIARSPLACAFSISPPIAQHYQSFFSTVSAVCYAAAFFGDSHRRCFCVYARVILYVEYVLS